MTAETLFDENDSARKQKRRRKRDELAQIEVDMGPKLPAVQQAPTSMVEVIAQLAANPNVDTVKMRELIELHQVTEARQQFHDAMVAMDLPRINRDGRIQIRGGKPLTFASFENLNKVIKPILKEHGFRMSYEPDVPPSETGIIVRCHLTRGLYRESCVVPVPTGQASPAMNAQQAVGAAIAYAKRYGTIALLNIETEAGEDRDTDAKEMAQPFSAAQVKSALKAVADNNVPQELIQKHYLEPHGVTRIHDLPASVHAQFMQSCKGYGERSK